MGGQEMKVTNVKFIDKETGKVVLSLDQAEIEILLLCGGWLIFFMGVRVNEV